MAFEDVYVPFVVMFMLALFFFPIVYVLDLIRKRVEPKKFLHKIALLFGISYIMAMVAYTFSIAEIFLPFESSYATYFLVLLLVFVVYLVAFNKTK